MASSELGPAVLSELNTLNIDTDAEVKDFRVPGPRRAAFDINTVLTNIQASRTQAWVSRKRVRHDALRLLREVAFS